MLLWDVDGTLLGTGGVGASVFDYAIGAVTGRRPGFGVAMSGKTDPQIVREYLAGMGVPAGNGIVDRVLRCLELDLAKAAAAGEIARAGRLMPGISELLPAVALDARVLSTVLTGNLELTARCKLAALGIDRCLDLEVGAYGSDDGDRELLVPIALGRAVALRGRRFDPSDVWVIGDTPRDLACARVAGTRCLLVATGRYTIRELDPLGADAVRADLSDVAAVLDLLVGDR